MSKVLTFSRTFPIYHPKAGEPTYFVEKLWASIGSSFFDQLADEDRQFNPRLSLDSFDPKHHTIRSGHRWKVGDTFSPRIWSGKPYASKMITIAPDIQIKKIWGFQLKCIPNYECWFIDGTKVSDCNKEDWFNQGIIEEISNNDGLDLVDFLEWFKHPSDFEGQIICWNERIEY